MSLKLNSFIIVWENHENSFSHFTDGQDETAMNRTIWLH